MEQQHEEKSVVESLQTLTARAWAKHMMQQEKDIPELAEAAVADRRTTLLVKQENLQQELKKIANQLKTLEQEKQEDIQSRKKALSNEIQAVVDTYQPVDPYRYCSKCKRIDFERLGNQCSVEGCEFYKVCPSCDLPSHNSYFDYYDRYSFWNDDPENVLCHETSICKTRIDDQENSSKGLYPKNISFPPYKTGYLQCWICHNRFCMDHFPKHYKACRTEASQHCGFSPPTKSYERFQQDNDGRYALCVPGHCGEKVKAQDCQWVGGDALCWQPGCNTTVCSKCVRRCYSPGRKRPNEACDYNMCKLHEECDGACKNYHTDVM